MKHAFFNGTETPDEIRRVLLDNCEGTEDITVQKRLTEDELNELRTEFANNNIEMSHIDQRLTDARRIHKDSRKPLVDENKEIISSLKTQYKEVTEKVYRLANFESGMMEHVNGEGEIVSSRRLRPDEKQGRLMPLNKAVNE